MPEAPSGRVKFSRESDLPCIMKAIFVADDWGLSASIHDAVIACHQAGALDAASIMMGQPFTQAAVSYARQNPDLPVGIHLFANDSEVVPLSRCSWPWWWPMGLAINLVLHLPPIHRSAVQEVRQQLILYRETGLRLDTINSHFQFHAHPAVAGEIACIVRDLFPEFRGWMRLGTLRLFGATRVAELLLNAVNRPMQAGAVHWAGGRNDSLWGLDRTFQMNAREIEMAVRSLPPGNHEFIFHPGRTWSLDSAAPTTEVDTLLALARSLPQQARGIGHGPFGGSAT